MYQPASDRPTLPSIGRIFDHSHTQAAAPTPVYRRPTTLTLPPLDDGFVWEMQPYQPQPTDYYRMPQSYTQSMYAQDRLSPESDPGRDAMSSASSYSSASSNFYDPYRPSSAPQLGPYRSTPSYHHHAHPAASPYYASRSAAAAAADYGARSAASAKHCCGYCGKKFNRPSGLKIHLTVHNGEHLHNSMLSNPNSFLDDGPDAKEHISTALLSWPATNFLVVACVHEERTGMVGTFPSRWMGPVVSSATANEYSRGIDSPSTLSAPATMPPFPLPALPSPQSASKPVANLPTAAISIVQTTVFVPETAPTLAPTTTTVVVTSVAPPPAPTTASPTAAYTTITQVLTTVPVAASSQTTAQSSAHETPTDPDTTSTTLTSYFHTTSTSAKASSFSARSSSTHIGPSAVPSPTVQHKPKSSLTGKIVGYSVGGFFLLLLLSSFFSAWRKRRQYVRKRPRASTFTGIGSKLSDGESTPPKRSMAQTLMRSVSQSSFDAYALCGSPPTTPLPVYPHPDSLLVTRGPGIRPLPPTPTPPKDDERRSPFGVSSSGSSGLERSMLE
uniref:C2H2-type domain-containing protein n=1 Tax=Mycena chlorophos TaxID=658473 RepID=A0ABQ0M2Z2_MYCCL|nr:predicted protein [Mycena chlorophos]